MRAWAALVALSLLLGACGVPQELSKQAEDVASVAAEGALLAHDAAEGDTIASFRRVHAHALRARVDEFRPAIESRQLAAIAASVSADLRRLEHDDAAAPQIQRRLDRAATEADELAR